MIPLPYRLLAVLALLVSAWLDGLWQGWHRGTSALEIARAQWAAEAASASAAAQAETDRRIDITKEISHVAQLAQARDLAAARSAADAHQWVLDAAAGAARRDTCTPDSPPAAAGTPASAAGLVLADVLGRADAAAGELAAALDRAATAGRACEQWAGAVMGSGGVAHD